MSDTIWVQKGSIISAFRETIIVANQTLAMCGAALTSLGSPHIWSDILADQTRGKYCYCLSCSGFVKLLTCTELGRVGLLSIPLHWPAGTASEGVYKILKLSFLLFHASPSHLCDIHPQGLHIPSPGTTFLSLFPSHNGTLGSETSDWPLTRTTIAMTTEIMHYFSISALI